MSEEETTQVYQAVRLVPNACPGCGLKANDEQPESPEDPGDLRSVIPTAAEALRVFPPKIHVLGLPHKYRPQLVRCARCPNITLQVTLGQRLVRTREEAEGLVAGNYSAFVETTLSGDVDDAIEQINARNDEMYGR